MRKVLLSTIVNTVIYGRDPPVHTGSTFSDKLGFLSIFSFSDKNIWRAFGGQRKQRFLALDCSRAMSSPSRPYGAGEFYSSQAGTFTGAQRRGPSSPVKGQDFEVLRMFDELENDPHSRLFPSDRKRAISIVLKLSHSDLRSLLKHRIEACKWLNRKEIDCFVHQVVNIRFSSKKKRAVHFRKKLIDLEMTAEMNYLLIRQISILEFTEILKLYKKRNSAGDTFRRLADTLLDDIHMTVSYNFWRTSLKQSSQQMPVPNEWVVKDVEFNSPCAAM